VASVALGLGALTLTIGASCKRPTVAVLAFGSIAYRLLDRSVTVTVFVPVKLVYEVGVSTFVKVP
jgi:hypothetical protein